MNPDAFRLPPTVPAPGATSANARLVCELCGAIGTAPNVAPEVVPQLRAQHGFTVRAMEVTAFGRCAHCHSG